MSKILGIAHYLLVYPPQKGEPKAVDTTNRNSVNCLIEKKIT
jgi:hypothetical protein